MGAGQARAGWGVGLSPRGDAVPKDEPWRDRKIPPCAGSWPPSQPTSHGILQSRGKGTTCTAALLMEMDSSALAAAFQKGDVFQLGSNLERDGRSTRTKQQSFHPQRASNQPPGVWHQLLTQDSSPVRAAQPWHTAHQGPGSCSLPTTACSGENCFWAGNQQ